MSRQEHIVIHKGAKKFYLILRSNQADLGSAPNWDEAFTRAVIASAAIRNCGKVCGPVLTHKSALSSAKSAENDTPLSACTVIEVGDEVYDRSFQ